MEGARRERGEIPLGILMKHPKIFPTNNNTKGLCDFWPLDVGWVTKTNLKNFRPFQNRGPGILEPF